MSVMVSQSLFVKFGTFAKTVTFHWITPRTFTEELFPLVEHVFYRELS